MIDIDEFDINELILIIKSMHNKIDYSVGDLKDRMEIIESVLKENKAYIEKYLNIYDMSQKNILSMLLERMGNYLIYLSRKDWRAHKTQQKNIDKNEIFVDDIEKYLEITNKKKEEKNIHRFTPITDINSKDKYKYNEVEKIYQAITIFRHIKSKKPSVFEVRKINKAIGQLIDDAKLAKEYYSGLIEFKNIHYNKPKYNFDNDTGYFDENGDYIEVSENQLDFRNKKHIYYLIQFYSELKQDSYEDNHSDMKYIIYLLEYLIDNADLTEREKDIIIWTIDGCNQDIINDRLKNKYDLNWYGDTLSRVFDSICSKIADFYEKDYEDWFYTFIARGTYKTCSKCGEVKLANERYFRKRNDDKGDGFRNECRICERVGKCGEN